VRIDGHDLRTVTIESLRRQLGVVPQEPYLFAGTVRENIAFARPDATDAEVEEAVRRVGLTELVAHLSGGLDTTVHERGVWSSGERQLIALARAFSQGRASSSSTRRRRTSTSSRRRRSKWARRAARGPDRNHHRPPPFDRHACGPDRRRG
jgi:ABC-type hemin transport system ATPase subunit